MLKLFRVTTTPLTFNLLLKNQLRFLSHYFEVYAISNDEKLLYDYARNEGVNCFGVVIKREISLFNDIITLFRFYFLFKNKSPNIVHTSTPKSSLLSMIASWMCGTKIRIYQVTGLRYESEYGIKRFILKQMEKITCFCATHIIAESKGVYELIYKDNLTNKNVSIVSNGTLNGIDTEYWSQSNISSSQKNALITELNVLHCFIFVYVGRIVKDKGIEELVNAFVLLQSKTNKNVKLLLVGNFELSTNSLKSRLIEQISSNSNIIFTGFQDDVRKYLSISNCLVLPSYREGFPNVCLQASSMGIPIIMTDVCGSDELINEHSGYMINKYDYQQLCLAMLKMLKNYNKFNSGIIRNNIINNYKQDVVLNDLLDFYRRL